MNPSDFKFSHDYLTKPLFIYIIQKKVANEIIIVMIVRIMKLSVK